MHSRIQKGQEYLKDNHKGLSRDAAESLKQAWDHLKLLDTELSRTIKIFDLVQKLQKDPSYIFKHGGMNHPLFEFHLKSTRWTMGMPNIAARSMYWLNRSTT